MVGLTDFQLLARLVNLMDLRLVGLTANLLLACLVEGLVVFLDFLLNLRLAGLMVILMVLNLALQLADNLVGLMEMRLV